MSQEIIYTSAPEGLKAGTRGFCTVVATRAMAKNLADQLEDLSGYRHLHAEGGPQAALNPVVYSHLKLSTGGRTYSVLSRICDAGFDYTQRSNKLAHHVALDPDEMPPGGPAALLSTPGFMITNWSGQPHVRDAGPVVPRIDAVPAPCQLWRQAAGDSGWAGVVASEFVGDSRRQIVLIYRPGTNVLALIQEALALLPAVKRRQATFSTFVTRLPPTVECRWRCYVEGTAEAESAARQQGSLIIDLRKSLGPAPPSAAVTAAREGRMLDVPATSVATLLTAVSDDKDDALLAALTQTEKASTATHRGRSSRKDSSTDSPSGYSLAPPVLRSESAAFEESQRAPESIRRRRPMWALIGVGLIAFLFGSVSAATLLHLRQGRLESDLNNANEQLATNQKEFGAQLARSEADHDKTKKLLAALQIEKDTISKQISKQGMEIADLTNKNADLEKEIARLRTSPIKAEESKPKAPETTPSNPPSLPPPPIPNADIAGAKPIYETLAITQTSRQVLNSIEPQVLDLQKYGPITNLQIHPYEEAFTFEPAPNETIAVGANRQSKFSILSNPTKLQFTPHNLSAKDFLVLRNSVLTCDAKPQNLVILLREPVLIQSIELDERQLNGTVNIKEHSTNKSLSDIEFNIPNKADFVVHWKLRRNSPSLSEDREGSTVDFILDCGKGGPFPIRLSSTLSPRISVTASVGHQVNGVHPVDMKFLSDVQGRYNGLPLIQALRKARNDDKEELDREKVQIEAIQSKKNKTQAEQEMLNRWSVMKASCEKIDGILAHIVGIKLEMHASLKHQKYEIPLLQSHKSATP